MRAISTLFALVLLTSCSRAEPPSEEVEKAAAEVVQVVEGDEDTGRLAPGRYAPHDECADLAGVGPFRRVLEAAIEARDTDVLVALAADDVKLDFGGGSGKAELRRRLDAVDGALWERLAPLAELGCAANALGGITLPWYFEQQIPAADPFATFIVTGEDVPVRRVPGADSPVVGRISWDAVEAVPETPEIEGYRHVRLIGAGEDKEVDGFVASQRLRSLIDYRLTATSRNGRWRIISLVSGD